MFLLDTPSRERPPALPPSGRRRRRGLWLAPGLALMLVLLPVVLLAGAGNPPCTTTASGTPNSVISTPTGPVAAGLFASPLQLTPDHWYRVGATEYGGSTGSIGGSQGDLPLHPDTYAELSTETTNPYPNFGFADANALDHLPYLTALRVANDHRQTILYKRDIGYGQGPAGQGPGRLIYRLDIYTPSAQRLDVSKTPVDIELAPATGTGPALGQTPASSQPVSTAQPCSDSVSRLGALTLTQGQRAAILPDGDASAPTSAPMAVKLAIAAGNQIDHTPYPVPDEHWGPLSTLWPAYDCSGSVSYVLYRAGLHSVTAQVSGDLETWGKPGPGRWITVYANSSHTWIQIAGLALDTSSAGNPPTWQPPGAGPRWRPDPTGNYADGLTYVVRHPEGL